MKVCDVRVKAPRTVHPDAGLATTADAMRALDCCARTVVNNKYKVVGFIDDRDICITPETRNRVASEILMLEEKNNQRREWVSHD